MKQKYLQLNVL